MKTNNLFKRIKKEIDGIPLIDLHTHIRIEHPNAKSLAEILFYHFVSLELTSSGADVVEDLPDFAHPLPEDEQKVDKILVKYIPYLKNIENTGTYQALSNIFRDLYEFDLRSISVQNYKLLYDRVSKTSSDDEWTVKVLKEKCKVETLVVTGYRDEDVPSNKWLKEGLFSLSPERGFLPLIKGDLLKGMSLEESLDNLFGRYLASGVLSVTGGLPADFHPCEPVREEEDRLLKKWLDGGSFSGEEPELENIVANKVFKSLNKKKMSWVIAAGTAVPPFRDTLPGQTILRINHDLIPDICKVLPSYPDVKLLILLNSFPLSQELCIAVRMIRNIYPLGIQWHNFYPVFIERIIRERLETFPMNRNLGFISDAYSTEWFYGKLSIFRTALAKVLTRKIEDGAYTEDLALRIARKWLYENPREVYFGEKAP